MSDLPTRSSELERAAPQLPVSWYFDERVFALEKQLLFDDGPGYVGHELQVPNAGDYQTLEWMDHAKALVRNGGDVDLITNICRHRQAIMLQGRGNSKSIVCPVHRWTYGMDGKLLGAPEFAENPCRNLQREKLQRWNGLLFGGRRDVKADLAGFELAPEFDFSNYVFDRAWIEDYPSNWKTFVEVYLELYHVEPFHPGLAKLIDCGTFTAKSWQYGANWSNQVLRPNDELRGFGTPAYQRYQERVLAHRNGRPPKFGTLWFTYYPNVMVELYPEALIVSTVIPRSPTLTTNVVEFFYPEEVAHFERELVEAHQAAYVETAMEDGEICTRMDRGRKALMEMGRDDRGPYQSPMEDGMVHFHEYLRRMIELRR